MLFKYFYKEYLIMNIIYVDILKGKMIFDFYICSRG